MPYSAVSPVPSVILAVAKDGLFVHLPPEIYRLQVGMARQHLSKRPGALAAEIFACCLTQRLPSENSRPRLMLPPATFRHLEKKRLKDHSRLRHPCWIHMEH